MKINALRSFRRASPMLVSILASAGVIGTAVLAAYETPKALDAIRRVGAETPAEKAKIAVRFYIPAVAAGAATILCIFSSINLNRRQQASLTSAYGLMSKQFSRYKGKLKELYGEAAHDRIIRELAKEKTPEDHIIRADGGFWCSSLDFENSNEEPRLFFDRFSDRYFESTIGAVLQAEYHINRNMVLRGYTTINEFYEFLGIECVPGGDDIGWPSCTGDDIVWVDFDHHYIEVDDGVDRPSIPCWVIETVFDPVCLDEYM